MYYFAYGSNMLRARLEQRVGSVAVVGAGTVTGHQLRFNKRSRDGSSKCNCHFTGYHADRIHGVVYALRRQQSVRLDEYERHGYRPGSIFVQVGSQRFRAMTYFGLDNFLHDDLLPFDWYHQLVLAGARQHGLQRSYIDYLQTISPQADQDMVRAGSNVRLLRWATKI